MLQDTLRRTSAMETTQPIVVCNEEHRFMVAEQLRQLGAEAAHILLEPEGRIVNVSSASGPMFVARCDEARAALLTKPDVTWSEVEALMRECLRIEEEGGDLAAAGLATSSTGSGQAYGLSKACLNAYTIALARENPDLTVNACTPGYIATDLTLPRAEGVDPASMGMKPPEEGTKATMHLLFGDPGGSGWYFGSDAQRSPLDRYRSPGDPPFTG